MHQPPTTSPSPARRIWLLAVILLGLAIFSLGSTPTARAATVTLLRKPNIHNVTPTSLVIQWTTVQSGASEVQYGIGNFAQTAVANSYLLNTGDSSPYDSYYVHEATLSGLTPNTLYQYKIFTDAVDLTPGGSITFRSGRSSSDTSFRFAAFGDSGQGSDGQQGVADRLLQAQPDLIVHGGDMIYSVASYKDLELKHFQVYEELIQSIWLAPSVGNHDYDYNSGKSIADSFINPPNGSSDPIEREMYYSFDYGNAHFTVMTSEWSSSNGSAQYNWAAADLAATSQFWKVVVFHEPPYHTSSSQGLSSRFGNLVDLFEQHGVDIVISGDRHFYERLKPILNGQETAVDDGGIFYVVSGGGGTGLGTIGSPPWHNLTAEKARLHHFVMFDVDDCRVEFSAVERSYNASDTFDPSDIFDTFTIDKCTAGPPAASFSGTPTSGTAPLTVNFSDQSSGIPTSWSWDFGDGNSSTEQSPTHIYTVPGTYNVSLTVTNSFGIDTLTRTNYVTVFIPPSPTADFSADTTTGFVPHTVQFSDQSANATSWSWDFGDGNSATEQNPSHTYSAVGSYNVSLTVTNTQGSDTMSRNNYITVSQPPAPTAAFAADTLTGAAPLTVNFSDQSTNNPTGWSWDFGDGNSATEQNPSHTYTSPGTYTVSLAVTNVTGSDSTTQIDYIVATDAPKLFNPIGDGHVKSSSPTSNYGTESQMRTRFGDPEYAPYLKFNVTNLGGAVAQATLRLYVDDGSDDSGIIYLTDSSWDELTLTYSNAPALGGTQVANLGPTANTSWVEVDVTSFVTGEGVYSFGISPLSSNSTYFSTKEGANPPELVITVADPAPTAAFSVDSSSGTVPHTVQFNDQSSGNPTSWQWEFGDGGSSTEQNPSYTFTISGTYTVSLTAGNGSGSDTAVQSSLITVSDPTTAVSPTVSTGVAANQADLVLSWPAQAGRNCAYDVYHAITPYFATDDVSTEHLANSSSEGYTVIGVLLDSSSNHYYLVQAAGCDAASTADSNYVGVFHFNIQPGQ